METRVTPGQAPTNFHFNTSAERELKKRICDPKECFKVAYGGPEVASELLRDIFEFFDSFFRGKEIIMRKK